MVVKHRLADFTYRWYDRMRAGSAFAAAAQAGTAPDFSGFEGNQYAVLVTFRKDGTAVPTPVWFALLGDRRLVIGTDRRTAKVRRIRRDSHARVFPSDPRGKPLGATVEGRARILEAVNECQEAEEALDRKYGRARRVYERALTRPEDKVDLEVVPAP